MSFLFIFLNVASIALLGFLLYFVARHFEITSARSLFALTFFALAWAVGSFAELLAVGLAAKIFWRDFTQVGSFFVPPASLIFALAYSGVASRKTRIVARILYEIDEASAASFAERLVKGVSCGEFHYEDSAIKVTISVGVAMLDGRDLHNPGAGFVEAFARADRALYKAKSEGKNRIARQGFDIDPP